MTSLGGGVGVREKLSGNEGNLQHKHLFTSLKKSTIPYTSSRSHF